MKRPLAILGAVALAAALSFSVSAAALKWHVRAPFTVTLVSELADPGLQALTVTSAADWSASPVVDFVFGPAPKRGPYIRLVDGYYGPVWSGLASISNDRGYITAVTIYLNRTNLDGAPDTFRQAVICQELGHGLGLGHSPDTDSCMSETSIYPVPNAADFAALDTLYGR
jgi:hypothetical protein